MLASAARAERIVERGTNPSARLTNAVSEAEGGHKSDEAERVSQEQRRIGSGG